MTPTPVCGPLDVGDRRAIISTDPVPGVDVEMALKAATASSAFDGATGTLINAGVVVSGRRTIAKAQHREHERLESALWFETVRTSAEIQAPALLDAGTVETGSGPRWWIVLERVNGDHVRRPTPAQQRAVGAQLRRWHDHGPVGGLRLDDPGGLGVFLGTPRSFLPRSAYLAVSEALTEACVGLPMAAVHGDVAVSHNSLFCGDDLAAIIDPGAVHVGPPMLDLAWCLAIDLPHGAEAGPLLDGYGRDGVDTEALEALLPHMMLRYLIDTVIAGRVEDRAWLAAALRERAPGLLGAAGLPDAVG